MNTHRLSRTGSPLGSTTVRTADSSVQATRRPPATKTKAWAATIIAAMLSEAELDRVSLQFGDGAVAEDAHGDGAADAFADHQALEVARLLDGDAVDVEDQVFVSETGSRGRAAGDDLDDLHAEATVDSGGRPRRQRASTAGDAEVGAAEPALVHEGGHDATGGGVERHGQAEPDAGDGGVDAGQPAPAGPQGAPRVPRVQGGGGLVDVAG